MSELPVAIIGVLVVFALVLTFLASTPVSYIVRNHAPVLRPIALVAIFLIAILVGYGGWYAISPAGRNTIDFHKSQSDQLEQAGKAR